LANPNLPLQPTPFVGRTDELADITALLADPACRLLTLVGPGGIGKTRLAVEAAARLHEGFADGVYFVDLQPVSATGYLVPTIAEAIGLTFYGQEKPRAQLIRYLGNKHLLLVVDNFEHLLDGADLLAAIIEAAPEVQLLVTSREALNRRAEWIYDVAGLAFPGQDPIQDLQGYDAVALFVERARRVRHDFALDDEAARVTRVCQLVGGSPLAIELAANWLKTLACADIVREIQHRLDFLTTSQRDVPERHRSMQIVFDPTWDRLSDQERQAFMKLCVFRGGFRRAAAEQVADASLPTLASLTAKSLVRLETSGRYQIHELLRQYGEAKLKETPALEETAHDRHCAYFTLFLHHLEPDMKSSGQIVALSRIEEEIDNVRAAWRWAVGKRMEREIGESLDSLALFYHIRCWYQEAEEAFRMAVEALENEHSVVLGRVLMWLGHSAEGVMIDAARIFQRLQAGASVLRDLAAYGETAMPLWMLSEFNDNPEMDEEIKQFCLDNLAAFRTSGDRWGTAWALNGVGNIALLERAYEESRGHAQEALALSKEIGDQLGMAAAFQHLIKVAECQKAPLEQKRYAQEALTHAQAIDDRGGIAAAQFALGRAAYKLGDYEEARQLLEQSVTLFRELFIVDVRPLAIAGEVALALGNHRRARHYLHEALQGIAAESRPMTWTMIAAARLLVAEDQKEWAVEALAAAASSRWARRYPIQAEITTLLTELEAELPPEVFVAARRRGESGDLKATVSALLDALAEHGLPADDVFPTNRFSGRSEQIQIDQHPLDPLSARELEVLQLVAEGWSNREIAQELVVTVGTVKKHLNNIFSKLHVRSRTQAIACARELDLLS
jgi:predicted ATPase/DNA-binding NarL/FixJ family response regulator